MTTTCTRRRYSQHDDLMAGYYSIREAEEAAAEDATCGYATELAEWWAEHPRTTFKVYLQGMAQR